MIISCLILSSTFILFTELYGSQHIFEQQQQYANDIRPVPELYVMGNDTNRWKGPCHRHYDSYDAHLRCFITWPRYLKRDPNTLDIADFWPTGKPPKHIVMTLAPLPKTLLSPFIFFPQVAVILHVFIAGCVSRVDTRQMIPVPITHFGYHFAFTSDT